MSIILLIKSYCSDSSVKGDTYLRGRTLGVLLGKTTNLVLVETKYEESLGL